MGPREPTKGNSQLEKWLFFDINKNSILFNKKNTKSNSLLQNICVFLWKEICHWRDSSALGPRGSKYYKLYLPVLLKKMLESSDSMYSSVLMLEKKLWSLFQLWLPRDSISKFSQDTLLYFISKSLMVYYLTLFCYIFKSCCIGV